MAVVVHPAQEPQPELNHAGEPPFCLNRYALEGHKAAISAVAFLENSQLLLTASADRTALLWNLGDEQLPAILSFRGAKTAYTDAALLESRCQVALCDAKGVMHLHSLADGSRIGRHYRADDTKQAPFHCLSAIGPNSLAGGTSDGAVLLWDLREPSRSDPQELFLGTKILMRRPPVLDIAPISDYYLATGSLCGSVRKFDMRVNKDTSADVLIAHKGLCSGLAVGENSTKLASIGEDGIWISDCRPYGKSKKRPRYVTGAHSSFEVNLPRLAWSTSRSVLIAASADGILRTLDSDDLELVAVHARRAAPLTDVAIHPSFDVVVSGATDGSLELGPLGVKLPE